jgi:hypothetical protein
MGVLKVVQTGVRQARRLETRRRTIDRTARSERVTGLIREDTVAPPPDLSTTSTSNRPDGDQNVHTVTIGGRTEEPILSNELRPITLGELASVDRPQSAVAGHPVPTYIIPLGAGDRPDPRNQQ